MKVKAFGFDQGATRDVGELFLQEVSKTLTNGSCPGHHNAVVESRGGAWSIGNGQLHDAMSPSKEICKTLNCMDDPMKILIIKEKIWKP